MHKLIFPVVALLCCGVVFGEETEKSLIRISPSDAIYQQTFTPEVLIQPADVLPESVEMVKMTNIWAVKWTYTEAGAKKMLSFWEEHAGQRVRTQVGTYQTHPSAIPPRDPARYNKWREEWLKKRSDKLVVSRERDAKAIYEGLKPNPK